MSPINLEEAVITTKQVMGKNDPILYFDKDGGTWQFLGEGEVDESDAFVCKLGDILAMDSTIEPILDSLPEGWFAERQNTESDWDVFELNDDE